MTATFSPTGGAVSSRAKKRPSVGVAPSVGKKSHVTQLAATRVASAPRPLVTSCAPEYAATRSNALVPSRTAA